MLKSFGASRSANTVVDNILSGTSVGYANQDSLLSIGAAISATGLEFNVYINGVQMTDRYIPVVKATAPLWPDDYFIQNYAIPAGSEIRLQLNNTTGGALTDITHVKMDPL